MLDSFNRPIYYLRLAVTGACNLRCTYCSPDDVNICEKGGQLSFSRITEIIQAAACIGFSKLRLTGGEPLVRNDIVSIVEAAKATGGIAHISMTTNGTLLAGKVAELRKAGMDSINISLDTLDSDNFRNITRGGNLQEVLDGIEAAKQENFSHIKINTVVGSRTDPDDLQHIQDYCELNGLILQRIKEYRLDKKKEDDEQFERPPRCGGCNRIRITADGFIKPCLHGNDEIPIDFDDIEGSLRKAIYIKPESGETCTNRGMVNIGG
ncbi:MAG: radical SAM protein [Bacteroidetes bacterium]|nr:radical SAM protein [Bacteroidota bacterium]